MYFLLPVGIFFYWKAANVDLKDKWFQSMPDLRFASNFFLWPSSFSKFGNVSSRTCGNNSEVFFKKNFGLFIYSFVLTLDFTLKRIVCNFVYTFWLNVRVFTSVFSWLFGMAVFFNSIRSNQEKLFSSLEKNFFESFLKGIQRIFFNQSCVKIQIFFI